MPRPRKLVVFGPRVVLGAIVTLSALAGVLAFLGQLQLAGFIVTAIVTRLLPIARGRPTDTVKLVTRGTGAQLRGQLGGGPVPPPLPLDVGKGPPGGSQAG